VLVLMGSDSDLPTMRKAIDALSEFGIETEVAVASAHRTPEKVVELVRAADGDGTCAIIAGAGMAAALPGVVAAHTTLPVIGVPLSGSALGGTDALYSIVQMPPGIPVATVGIDAAANAGLLAAQIAAVSDPGISEALKRHRTTMAEQVEARAQKVREELQSSQ
jgi:5-(carboxyamino)imidazole ribonucleotide mutase